MTVKEKLLEEFGCAITSVLGDLADQEYSEGSVDSLDLRSIAEKVAWYLER